MDYNKPYFNDSPILDDDAYLRLMRAYQNRPTERNVIVNKIYFELIHCRQLCLGVDENLNKKIKDGISYAKSEIDKIIENFESSFSISVKSDEVKNFNLFTFIKKISECISFVLEWQIHEEKPYYKALANSTISSLNMIITKIITTLEHINVIIFKYL